MGNFMNQKGFTLIEIMIAVFLIAVALIGVAGMTTMTIKGNAFSKMQTTATTIAKDRLEILKNVGFGGIDDGTAPDCTASWTPCSESAAYEEFCDILNSTTAAKTIEMKVRFRWQTNYHQVAFKTIIANEN
ncbi:MAG: prepilin-type N-terminal cleavage/methylation domain-containing protein [Deltaproteobacteria bacterium]|nr:prepilin-type N-terminal cleavage/methylation domain-containing protein [Deltaproteobacteria bacterium]